MHWEIHPPRPSRFPSTLEISLGLRPREISRVSPNLLGVGDGFPNTALVLVEHEYIALQIYSTYILSKQITKQMEQHVEAYPLSLFPNVIVLEYCAHWLQEVVTGWRKRGRSLIEDINSNFLLLNFLTQQSQQAQVILSQQLNINLELQDKERREKMVIWSKCRPMRRFTATFSRLTLENNSPAAGQEFEFQILRWSKFNRWFTLFTGPVSAGLGWVVTVFLT